MLRSAQWLQTVILAALVLALVALGACSDDDDDGDGPSGPGSTTGTIVVSTQTDDPETVGTWTLTGPGDLTQTGSGSTTLTEMQPGDYAIAWDDIENYETPPPRTGTLQAGRVLTLVGSYDFIEPPVIIDVTVNPEPDEIEAPWTLTLPDDSMIQGEGDSVITDLGPGDYTITWGTVVDWITPPEGTALDLDEDHEFTGVYEPLADPFGEFVRIPGGTFDMGAENGDDDELPIRTVTLTHDIDMSETEITNLQFAELMMWAVEQGHATLEGDSLFDNLDGSTELLYDFSQPGVEIVLTETGYVTALGDYPIFNVSWKAAVAYCDWLSLQEELPRAYDHETWECHGGDPYGAQGYRLPTEAEWEYACRAGTTTDFATGDMPESYSPCSSDALDDIGWFCGNAGNRTNAVQQLVSNDFDLYDMHGNVWEWCNDWYGAYDPAATTDPVGPASSEFGRVIRGGSWYSEVRNCRSANRYPYPSLRFMGFRPVRTVF